MIIDWDVPIVMEDGAVLRADVFRPEVPSPTPVVLSHGPYAKGLTFQEGYPDAWRVLVESHPGIAESSSCRYQAWEVVDPEVWTASGYSCVRVDARGWGRSPGFADPWSPQETRDLYACIEWAGTQPWSTGRVGLNGISYFAMNQWQVAALAPPHLTAMIPWEGLSDFYRDFWYHGGIRATSPSTWYSRVVASVQHGLGERGATNPNTGELACGPETLTDEELAANRADWLGSLSAHPRDGEFWRPYQADWSRITVPFLSAGNWGGAGMHLRGNSEAFLRAAAPQKWLEIHGREHWTEFYTDYGRDLQMRFFDHFLKGEDNGWAQRSPVTLRVRTVDGFRDREEQEWPAARTEWTRLYLDSATAGLARDEPSVASQVTFQALAGGVTFRTRPLEQELEFAGHVAVKLFISSSTQDADLFLVLRVFDPAGNEVVHPGAVDPHTPVGQGWLRASSRALDPERSTPFRPYHRHTQTEWLTPGDVYELDVEIWPSSHVVPPGYTIGLTVRGTDYEYEGADELVTLSHFKDKTMKGSGIYLHDDPAVRPPEIYGGETSVLTGATNGSYLLLPVLPS